MNVKNNMFKVKVENLKQLDIVVSAKNVCEVILSRDSFNENDLPKLVDKIKKNNKLAWIMMERISRYEEDMAAKSNNLRLSTDKIYEIKNLDGIIIQNLDSFTYMLRRINKAANEQLTIELNYTMNCYNLETRGFFEKLYNEKRNNASDVPLRFTAPVELNIYELAEVGYETMILYSYIDTMVTANCLRKNVVGGNVAHAVRDDGVGVNACRPSRRGELCEPTCKYRFKFDSVQDYSSYIIDRKGKKLYYKTYCKYCYNKIFNTEPLFLLDKIEEIQKSDILRAGENVAHSVRDDSKGASPCVANHNDEQREFAFRIDFSFENENQVKDILTMKCPESFTRGHYKSSIK